MIEKPNRGNLKYGIWCTCITLPLSQVDPEVCKTVDRPLSDYQENYRIEL